MHDGSNRLSTWGKLGLTILPGILILVVTWSNTSSDTIPLRVMMLLLTMALVGVVANRRPPVWSYVMWGLLSGSVLFLLPSAWMIWNLAGVLLIAIAYSGWICMQQWQCGNLSTKSMVLLAFLWVWTIVLPALLLIFPGLRMPELLPLFPLPVVAWIALAWLPMSWRNGAPAILFVLGFGFVFWEEFIDFDYFISLSSWDTLMTTLFTILLLILAPICLLRFRSMAKQTGSLLMLIALTFFGITILSAMARHQPSILTNPPINLYLWVPGKNGINGVGLHSDLDMTTRIWFQIPMVAIELLNMALILILYQWFGKDGQDKSRLDSTMTYKNESAHDNLQHKEVSSFINYSPSFFSSH